MRSLSVLLLGALLSACPSTENTNPPTPNPDYTNTNDGGTVQNQDECTALTEPGEECNSTCECLADGCGATAVCAQLITGPQYCSCTCLSNADCNSGCCLQLSSGDARVCAPAAACQPGANVTDAGTSTGSNDAGAVDAGPVDAGPVDAGPVDAGPADASVDAGTDMTDAGTDTTDDAGADAGTADDTDAGLDAGTDLDGGADAGV